MKRYDAWSEPDPQCGYGGARCELYERTMGQYVRFDDHERAVAKLAAEVDARDEVITRLLEMYVPANDDNGNEPFYCEGCGWTGFDVGIGGDRPEDEYLTCAECGDAVDEITKYNRIFLAAQYRRACEIAGRTE